MEDNSKSMIESARRMARRLARSTGTPYQTCLDDVARQLGREHWAAYARDPVAVPRETRNTPVDAARAAPAPDASRSREEGAHPFNVLLRGSETDAGEERDEFISNAADIMMGDMARPNYFDARGKDALVAFMHWEVTQAEAQDRDPSIGTMVHNINEGIAAAGAAATVTGDRMGEWLDRLTADMVHHRSATGTFAALAAMSASERNRILGTMDRALAPYARRMVTA